MQWFRRKLSAAVSTALAGKPVEATRRPTALLMPLEPRIMFDGAILATAEAAHADPVPTLGSNVVAVDAGDIGSVCGVDLFAPSAASSVVAMDAGEIGTVCGVDLFEPTAVATAAPTDTANAVVFVDSRVQEADSLLANIAPGTDIVYLDAAQDGLQQIADYLEGHSGARSVQLIAHGNDGDLWLGSTYLSSANIDDHATTLAAIGAGIQHGGDILIYGCETAAGEQGTSFISSFAALTGRDVAASDDRTGASGDWDLEISVGSIEAAPALASAATGSYSHDLAIITVTNGGNSGTGSLRNALTNASNGDTITFSGAGTSITITTELVINKNLTIDGDLDDNGSADVTIDANYSSRVLSITTGTVSLDGLVIREGRVSGNGGGLNSLPAGGLGGGISITGGTVTIRNSTITSNVASGGGGGGAGDGYSYGGGGGGGFNAIGGGRGGDNGAYLGRMGMGGIGGIGGYYSDPDNGHPEQAGQGGSTSGGAGGMAADGYFAGGTGATASGSVGSIGGGGGGAGGSYGGAGGAGGGAAGGLYIGSGATVFMSTTTFSNNLGAGGGGGGGAGAAAGGAGGIGVGGILNAGTLNYQSSTVTFTGNDGVGGFGGDSGVTAGANGASVDTLTGGTIFSNFVPNVAPTVANLNGDSVSFTEGGGAVLLDASGNATVTDADSADFSGGNVTVAIVTNRVAGEDVLAVRNQGSGAGQIGVSGSNITFAGTTIGTFTGGTGTNNLVITLNASATPAAVQALVRNLTYSNSNSAEPSTTTRTVRVTVNDGDGGTSSNQDVSVSVLGANDGPSLMANGESPTFTENGSAVDLFSSVSISTIESGQTITALTLTVSNLADGDNEILRIDGTDVLLTDGNNGTTSTNSVDYTVVFIGNTATVTLSKAGGVSAATAQTIVDGMAYRNDSDNPDVSSRAVDLTSISDSGGTSNGGSDTSSLSITAVVSVQSVNDAPMITAPGSISVTEDTASDLTGISFADADVGDGDVTATLSVGSGVLNATSGAGVTVMGGGTTSLTLTGSVADINAFIAASNVTFTTASNATANVTLTVDIDDGGNTGTDPGSSGTGSSEAASTTVTLSVVAFNDAPTVTVPATIAVNEDTATALTGISFTDVDAGSSSVTATLSVASGVLAATSGGGVTVGGTATAMTLTGTVANINAFIAGSNVTFTPASNASGDVTLTSSIDDNGNTGLGGPQSDSDTTTLQITAVNDAPSITAPGSISVTEDVTSALTGISFSDVDAGSASVTVTLSLPSGTLAATSGGGVTVGGTATALTLTGSIAMINTFIAGSNVTFTTDSNAASNVTLTVAIDDGGNTGADPGNSGTGSSEAASTTVTLSVTAVNDAPTVTVPATIAVNEDTTTALTGISFTDLDAGSSSVTATLSVASGALAATSGGGVTVGGTATALTLTGSVADINAFIAGSNVTFTPASNASGDVTLTTSIDDGGNTGLGGAQTDSDTTTLQVTALNDRPNITAPGSISVTEDVSTALTGISFSDVDAGSASVTVTFSVATVGPSAVNGTLTATSGSGVSVAGSGTSTLTLSGSIADINAFIAASSVSFLTAQDATISYSLTVTIDDGGNTGADPGTSGTSSTEARSTTVTLSTSAVNDAPTVTVPATIAVNEDTTTALTGISFTDLDAGSSSVTVTLSIPAGALAASSGGGVTVGGTATALTLTGSVANINAFIVGSNVTFTPAADASGDVTLTTSIDDGGNTGSGGAQTDSDTTTLQVTALNDRPNITAPGSISVTEDVSVALTGISFSDVDAGSGSVTVTLAVATVGPSAVNGTLTATAGNGVGVAGSGTSTLTLSGTIADINAFIAASSVSFLSAQDATISYNLSVTIDDGGNTGADPGTSGTSSTEARSTTVLLAVTAVNDGPVNTVPSSQQVDQDGSLVFSSLNSNAISIADVDASSVQVTLTAANGVINLSGTTGLSFSTGTGTGDATMTFTGSVADINTALQGLTFTPTASYVGAASLQVVVNDQGATGSGGAQSDTDSIDIDVAPVPPTITGVTTTNPDGLYKFGESVFITVTFDDVVNVFNDEGSPSLSLATGTFGATATYISGSGTNALTFEYVVQNGDATADLDYQDNMSLLLNGASIRSGFDVDALLELPTVGGANSLAGQHAIVIDGVVPIASIVVADTALAVGETSLVTITFNQAVTDFDNSDVTVANGTLSTVSSADGGVTWTATFTPTSGVTEATNLITVKNQQVQDAVGNFGIGPSTSNEFAIDTARPTATIVVADTALAIGETSLVTITFSEAVTGLTTADLTVANGTLSSLSSADGGVTWTATLTPDAAVTDTSNLITLDNTGVQDAAGNTGSASTDSNNYAVDTVRPTASIVIADTALAVGQTSLVTITFSEAVTGLTTADLTVANGALSGLSSADGGVTWTATLTPDAAVTDTSNLITLDNTGVQDSAGNTGSGTTDSNNFAIDTVRPTATIVVADTALAVGQTSLVTITFSDAVTGLTTADLTVANGTLSGLSSADGGVTWTATLTPDAAVTDTSNLITLDNTGVQDAAGNTGSGTTDSNNYAIDTARPTATIVVADTALAVGESSLVTITFSEAVTGLTTADLTVANGTLSALSSSDGGVTWTATFTPDAAVTDTSNLITLDDTGVQDAVGNAGSGSTDSNNYAIDTVRPTASIVVADTALIAGESSLVTITFSEAVTGLTTTDFSVANGTLSSLSSSDGGVTWTATLTPDAAVTDTSNLITLDNTGVQDAAGNAGSGSTDSNNYAIDTVRPTATVVVADTALAVGESSLVTITFSEAVTGLTTADFSVANGTLSALSSSDGGVTWTATFTPDAAVTDTSNLITLDNTGVQDSAGNTGSGTTDSNNYAIDTARPTATIVVADTALAIGETSLVTITFSEAVTGLTTADLTVANGTLSSLSSADGGVTWTATLTPDAAVTDTSNLITLDNTGVQDAAGNAGSASTDSNNYAIDTVRPTASIVIADTALAVGQTSLVTITFSEAVTGLTTTDFSVANGTLSALSSSDGGVTWTATLTPDAAVTDTSNLITLDNTGVQDAAGNTGSGTTDSNNYAIDTVRPTAAIVVADAALAVGESSLVTITFSEAVTGLTTADFTVANGTLSALSTADGGVTWTATLTPDAAVTDTSNLITLDNTGVQDAAGNTGSGATDSNDYAIDTAPPTATIVVADATLAAGETSLVTITFSEAVSGFTNADLSVVGGTLSAVGSLDGGITWTATLTPNAALANTANVITLSNTGVQDAAGNAGVGSTDSNSFMVDTVRPTGTIVLADTALAAGETTQVTITFSEAVSDFSNADLTVANGTLSAVSSSDGGVTWTATFTPSADVEAAGNVITLNAAGVQDAAGNTGLGSTDSNAYAVETARPTATILVADTALAVGETTQVTITFSEAVSGFSNADLTVANGTLSTVSSSDGGVTWTATFTPSADVAAANNVVTLNDAGVQDAAGNTGLGTTDSNEYAIDTARPTATIVLADTALAAGESTQVTITFSEAVSGFSNADLVISGGTLSAVSSSDGGVTWTATFTPSAGLTDATNVITLSNAGVQDAAGNTGLGTTDSNEYAIDTARPTATIVLADTALAAGESTQVTITFSEAVSGFSNADLVISGGTLSAVSSSDGGVTWTATFTPSAGLTDATNVITLSNAGVQDAAGNAGSGTTESVNYGIDTALPTATLTLLGAVSADSGVVTYQLQTSEAVSGVDAADFVLLSGGSVTAEIQGVVQIDAQTYRITVVNVQGEGTLALALAAATGIVDAAGNALGGNLSSSVRNVDTVPAVMQTNEPVLLPAPPLPPSAPATTPLIVLPVVTQTGTGVAGGNEPSGNATGSASINSIIAASTSLITPMSDPPGDASRTAGADRGVSLVAPAAGSYLGFATGSGGAPLRALPDLGVHTVNSDRFSIPLPYNTFSVGERAGADVIVQVRLANGQPLPNWLKFDARTGTLTGRPPAGFSGTVDVEISARDTRGNRAASVIHIDVQGARPTAGRAGLDAQFKSARQEAQLDARLVRQLAAAARAPAALDSTH